MEGFFTKKETESITRPDGRSYSCYSCGLFKECKSPKMQPCGNFKKKILNIGEAPGEIEDKNGKPFQGKTGKLLQRTYQELGIDLFEDCLNINAVNCRPTEDGENRTPVNYEIECCRKSVLQVIEKYKPKVIVLLGNSAIYSLIGHRWKKDFGTISKWRGWTIPDQDFKSWICPTFHPSYVERNEDDVTKVIWKQDLKNAIEKIKEPLYEYKEPEIEIIKDLNILNSIKSGTHIVPDFETTGKKPHALGHKIVCIGIADSPDHTYVFMVPESRRERQPIIKLFNDETIPKIGQNIKFEHAWSNVIFRQEIKGWKWDTMLASHILDNRPGITGLKFQTYVNFGIVDYASEIDPYLKVSDGGGNSINKIFELLDKPGGQEKLLKYCGYDTINEYRLALKQIETISNNTLPF